MPKVSFQSTRPYGARPSDALCGHPWTICFNPRARMGRDYFITLTYDDEYLFQSTRPYGARRDHYIYISSKREFQSTRPYGARQVSHCSSCKHHRVSIHAPVWGATDVIERKEVINGVSIHAPVWGATYNTHYISIDMHVSIHAPVWGAT